MAAKPPEEAERAGVSPQGVSLSAADGAVFHYLGFNGGLMALNDRLKLRSMVVAEKDDRVFIASEEAAIRTMEPEAENVWAPMGGEPCDRAGKGGNVLMKGFYVPAAFEVIRDRSAV